ncbi:MAG TPA: hypothetical protein VGO96_18175 [Pyrinomonadaceae bacterium]|jgi:hypothetical protein|nr:hypothetical protein [Pyrinomonadaceae bacterium]
MFTFFFIVFIVVGFIAVVQLIVQRRLKGEGASSSNDIYSLLPHDTGHFGGTGGSFHTTHTQSHDYTSSGVQSGSDYSSSDYSSSDYSSSDYGGGNDFGGAGSGGDFGGGDSGGGGGDGGGGGGE